MPKKKKQQTTIDWQQQVPDYVSYGLILIAAMLMLNLLIHELPDQMLLSIIRT